MRVISVDPGYDRIGVAVLEMENGSEQLLFSNCIETEKKLDLKSKVDERDQSVQNHESHKKHRKSSKRTKKTKEDEKLSQLIKIYGLEK